MNSLKISKDDFVKFRPEMAEEKHVWEVVMPFGTPGHLQFRQLKYTAEEYGTPQDCYEAVCDYVRGCRMCDMDYYVFCDDKLVLNF